MPTSKLNLGTASADESEAIDGTAGAPRCLLGRHIQSNGDIVRYCAFGMSVLKRREWWLGGGRYVALSLGLVAFLAAHARSDAWIGDFWTYVATLQELAARPFHPHSPLLGGARAFAFLSPYMLALGLVVRWTGARAFDVLVIAGLVNSVLLLGALYAFIAVWVERRTAAFYALLFLLFLWGGDPWLYSGFFHLRSLTLVSPYPSAFCTAVALSGLAVASRLLAASPWIWAMVMLLVSAFLWCTHPITALFFFFGLLAWFVGRPRPFRDWILLGVVLGGGLCLAFTWPLYPVADLLLHQNAVVHEGNDAMYSEPLRRVWPALLGVPFVILRLRRSWRDPLALLAIALTGLVIFGGVSGQWTWGRLLQHAVLLLQIALADGVAVFEASSGSSAAAWLSRRLLAPGVAAILIACSWSSAIKPGLDESVRQSDPRWLSFLADHVDRDSVVLTDLEECWFVPSFAGKVVAFPMRLPFVPDHDERIAAVSRFFERGVSIEERRRTIERYGVAYILFPKPHFADWAERLAEIQGLGKVVYSNADFVLIDVSAMTR